jgi:GNAT superfamily N-acetyltransferase
MGLLAQNLSLSESLQGVYPVHLEEVLMIDEEEVTLRPAKPVDQRRLQEHFYNLDEQDVIARFLHAKSRFNREEIADLSQTDFVNDLTMVAVVGEFGFSRVVGVGEYVFDPAKDLAEVAFSVSSDFQGKGLGRMLMKKLCQAARENGIAGLIAYVSPRNTAMVRLFNSVRYRVQTVYDGDLLELSCRFDEPVGSSS